MGLTMSCARCHEHKYDPITQEEYYQFYAFFDRVPELGLDGLNTNAAPRIPAPTARDTERRSLNKSNSTKVYQNL